MISIFTDGGSRNNPGKAAIGFVVFDENQKKLFAHGERIGLATNNVAEYQAILHALSWLFKNKEKVGHQEISFYLDSRLVYSQLNGLFKIRDSDLRMLLFKIKEKEAELGFNIAYHYVPREKNREADRLVNLALDGKI